MANGSEQVPRGSGAPPAGTMNSLERVRRTLSGLDTDKIAVNHRGFSSRAASHILGREAFVGGGIQLWREARSLWEGWHEEFIERSFTDALDLARLTGQDIVRSQYWRNERTPTGKVDENTYLFQDGAERTWMALRYDPACEQARYTPFNDRDTTREDLVAMVTADEMALRDYRPGEQSFVAPRRAQRLLGADKVVEVGGTEVSIPLTDDPLWLEMLVTDPGLVKAHLAVQVERARRNVPFLAAEGFSLFLNAGDLASNAGPMFSPRCLEEVLVPPLRQTASLCHACGAAFFYASDGNLWPVAEGLFERTGIDGYFEIDRRAGMDLAELRRRYPRLRLMGNISSWTLSRGTPCDVREEVISSMEAARRHRGIIVGASNYVQPETPEANIDALLEAMERYR